MKERQRSFIVKFSRGRRRDEGLLQEVSRKDLECWPNSSNEKPERRLSVTMTIMTIHQPLLSLIAGILILVMPKSLSYIVAIYLIIIGILGLVR